MSYYIPPTTSLRLLNHVPLSPNFENTIYFPTKVAQYNYFVTKTKFSFIEFTYQRETGKIRVPKRKEEIYDCNYLMYQNFNNTEFVEKWFYAFILNIEYVNNNTSEITFQIDPIQTWLYDPGTSFLECFIERCHTPSDRLFENLIPEDLDFGESVEQDMENSLDMNSLAICVITSRTYDGLGTWGTPTGKILNNIYNGLQYEFFYPEDIGNGDTTSLLHRDINAWLDKGKFFSEYQDDIIGIYMIPRIFESQQTLQKTIAMNYLFQDGENTWEPNNRKIYTGQFNYLEVSNNCGEKKNFYWEDWVNTNVENCHATFEASGCFINVPEVILYPTNYCKIEKDWDSGIKFDKFPFCAWTGDAFRAYWARAKNDVMAAIPSLLTGRYTNIGVMQSVREQREPIGGYLAGGPSGLVPYNPSGMAQSGAMGMAAYNQGVLMRNIASLTVPSINPIALANTAAGVLQMYNFSKTLPNRAHGAVQSSYVLPAASRLKYTFRNMHLKLQLLKLADKYFDRYGYSIKETGIPNINARPYYTYVKTKGCAINGAMPQDDNEEICKILDNGITFWKHGNDVGNYSVDNRAEVR